MVIGAQQACDPWNEIQVIAEDLSSFEPGLCELVHLFSEIDNSDHGEQDQHNKKERAQETFENIFI